MTDSFDDSSNSDLFESMVSEFSHLVRQGESPDINEFASRNDELTSRVLRLFPVLEMMEKVGIAKAVSDTEMLAPEQHLQFASHESWVAPKKLGDYRLVREIGRGGMGVVYEAEQESLGRRVAIKVLPASAQFDQRRMERFLAEAKASAVLHHTNIVPVFGIGCENGLSFLVMQLINGQPLSRVLQEVAEIRDLSASTVGNGKGLTDGDGESSVVTSSGVRALLQSSSESGSSVESSLGDSPSVRERNYFRNVAKAGVDVSDALHYAHKQGVLHRDIKPSNLLLDEQGVFWITDFGLAKHFDSPDITQTGEVVGTLRYMSPEQLEGNASSSSDIFGLGVTLYEMLTLQPANPGMDRKRLLEKIAEADPVSPRSIDSRIPRDLETIVMKCIQSDPSKRYATAAEVGEDLTRFIEGQPIRARRIGQAEKAWKWCCRRPALAAMMAALAVSILLGIAGVGWQWSKATEAWADSKTNLAKAQQATLEAHENATRAESHFNQARSAVVQLMGSISRDELLTNPDLMPIRRKLLLKALEFQKDLVQSYPEKFDVQLELANAWLDLADVSKKLPDAPETERCIESSRTILESLLKRDLNSEDRERVVISLAENYSIAGEIKMRQSPEAKFDVLEGVQILLDGRKEEDLSNVELIKLGQLYRRLGDTYTEQNTSRPHPLSELTEKALEHYRKSFEMTNVVFKSEESNRQLARMIAGDHRKLGMANRRLKNKAKAFEHYTASVEQFRELVALEPENTDFRSGLAEALGSIAFYYTYAEGNTKSSLKHYHESIDEYRKLSTAYPSVLKFIRDENKVTMNCCILYERVKRSSEATKLRQRSLELSERSLMLAPSDPKLLSDYGKALSGMGSNCTRRGNHEEALQFHLAAREQHEKAVLVAPLNPVYRIRLCQTILMIGKGMRTRGGFKSALDMYLEALEHENPDEDVVYMTARAMLLLARKIKYFVDDATEDELKVADKAIEMAKEVVQKFSIPNDKLLKRIHSDKRLNAFVDSEQGAEFIEWLSN